CDHGHPEHDALEGSSSALGTEPGAQRIPRERPRHAGGAAHGCFEGPNDAGIAHSAVAADRQGIQELVRVVFGIHGDTPLGTSRATERKSSVASFRYTPVDRSERCPSTSPITLIGTPPRSRLTARPCLKICAPRLTASSTSAARHLRAIILVRALTLSIIRYGARARRNTPRTVVRGRACFR